MCTERCVAHPRLTATVPTAAGLLTAAVPGAMRTTLLATTMLAGAAAYSPTAPVAAPQFLDFSLFKFNFNLLSVNLAGISSKLGDLNDLLHSELPKLEGGIQAIAGGLKDLAIAIAAKDAIMLAEITALSRMLRQIQVRVNSPSACATWPTSRTRACRRRLRSPSSPSRYRTPYPRWSTATPSSHRWSANWTPWTIDAAPPYVSHPVADPWYAQGADLASPSVPCPRDFGLLDLSCAAGSAGKPTPRPRFSTAIRCGPPTYPFPRSQSRLEPPPCSCSHHLIAQGTR